MPSNTTYYRVVQAVFMALHASMVGAALLVMRDNDHVYYDIYDGDSPPRGVHLLYSVVFAHGLEFLFHGGYVVMAETIVDHWIFEHNRYPTRWLLQSAGTSASWVSFLLVLMVPSVDLIRLALALHAAVAGFCLMEDEYISRTYRFAPMLPPHALAIPL